MSLTQTPSGIDITELVLAALQTLDESDFKFKSERSTLIDQQLTINGQPEVTNDITVVTGSGFRIHELDGLNISMRRTVEFPGSQNQPGFKGEFRLASGKVYVTAETLDPKLGYPALPEGWVKVNGPASCLYWPGLYSFSSFDIEPGLDGDVVRLFSGRTFEQLRVTLTGSLAEAELKKDTAKDGSPVDVITLSLTPDALMETFIGIDPDDPAIPFLANAAGGNPVTHRFVLDQAGRLLSWDQAVLIDLKDLDLSSVPGMAAGTKLTVHANQRQSLSFNDPEPGLQAVAAPAEAEMTRYPAFSGSAPESEPPFRTLDELDDALNAAVLSNALNSFWAEITALKQMPLIFEDIAVFFYRGGESAVAWDGDWSRSIPSSTYHFPGTDLWIHAVSLPPDSRVEYQIWLGGDEFITDPLNPFTEVGGLGTKSVAVMPEYGFPEFTLPHKGIPQGELTEDITLSSDSLGYDVNYRVYTPSGYESMTRLPVLYVIDGQDYLQFGRMDTALDNLIAAGTIQPIIAVFVDPRDTESGENLREQQFLDNPKYAAFITQELLPAVEAAYRTDPSPDARVLLGASYGGYFAASFALSQSQLFHLFALQSPSIAHNPAILDQFKAIDHLPIKIFMNVGTLRDTTEHTRLLRDILQERGYSLQYIESNEGHSYGNWRGKFEEMLAFFFGKE